MTLQERYDAEKSEAQALGQRYQQGIANMREMEREMLAADARLKLLEDLLASGDPLASVVLEGAAA